jgi:RimJ/RimL family protein N-acetyltransferase
MHTITGADFRGVRAIESNPGSEGFHLPILETERLILRELKNGDAEFILKLLNEPSFVRNIGDKGVRTEVDALHYIQTVPIASYERFGFGLYLVELKDPGVSIGICGLIKRDSLENVDIGFAFLPSFWSKGYAFEAASAVMVYGRDILGISRIVAITSPDNSESIRVLEKLGLRFERTIRLSEGESELKLFAPED